MAEVKIDTSTIKPNSHKYRDEQMRANEDKEKLAPIVKKEKIVSTKKPLSQKFADVFISEDSNEIANYVLLDVIIPGIKNAVLKAIEFAFYGTISDGKRRSRNDDRTDYRSYYDGASSRREYRTDRSRRRARRDDYLDYRNIVLLNRDDTEELIHTLHKRIDKYGSVSIAELFELIDERSDPKDNDWGWTDTRDIRLRRVSNGFLVDVEDAEYIG